MRLQSEGFEGDFEQNRKPRAYGSAQRRKMILGMEQETRNQEPRLITID